MNAIDSPYTLHWREYRQEWQGVVPLPWRRKDPPPAGITGEHGVDPTDAQLRDWEHNYSSAKKMWQTGNIGLHLPDGVIGVDFDAYKEPNIRHIVEAATGPLPPTICSSARVHPSGIRLYRCPTLGPTQRFKTAPFPACEIIQRRHRYVVVWPSIHPDVDGIYRWIDERTGETLDRVPRIDELEWLPDEAFAWLVEEMPQYDQQEPVPLEFTDGEPHGLVVRSLEDALEAIRNNPGGRHEAMTFGQMKLMRLAAQGYPGVDEALKVLRRVFIEQVGGDGRDAAAEFDRGLKGGQAKVEGTVGTMPTYEEYEAAQVEFEILPAPAGEPARTPNVEEVIAKRDEARAASWAPVDLAPVLSDDYAPLRPDVLERPDGKAMFYPLRVNMLMGESGGGKSWVALLAVAVALDAGQAAVYVDLEDHPRSITDRLRALGVAPEAIAEHFTYIRPDVAAKAAEVAQVKALLDILRPALLVIDSVGEAMALQGLKQNDDDEVARWFNFMPREWAEKTCVLLIDHVPKSSDANPLQAIGSQRKKAAIDGAMYRVEQVKPMGQGLTGRLTLITAKDRHGAHAIKSKACEIEFASSSDGTVVRATLMEPEERDEDGHVKRPTVLMERVSRALELNPGLSGRQLETTVSGKAGAIRKAVQVLVDEGFVRAVAMPGRGGGLRFEPIRSFREAEFEVSEPEPRPLVPTASQGKGTRFEYPEIETASPRPPSVRTEGTGTRFEGSNEMPESEVRPSGGDALRSGTATLEAERSPAPPPTLPSELVPYWSDDLNDF